MNLRESFVHNVLVHPLLFVADVLDHLGVGALASEALDALHDITAPIEDPEPGPLGDPQTDDGDLGEVAPQTSPRTAATAALEWRPRPPAPAPPPAPPPPGSARARMQAGRGTR